jgi:hypothetical protein
MEDNRQVARNTVRNVLAGADAVGKTAILHDVLASLRADGARMEALLRELQAEELSRPRQTREDELAAGAQLIVRRLVPVSEDVEGETVLDRVGASWDPLQPNTCTACSGRDALVSGPREAVAQ